MAAQPCSVCGATTYRTDGVCDSCWRKRAAIEESEIQAGFKALIEELEREWRLLDRIDWDQRRK